jgi:hypothetical protein
VPKLALSVRDAFFAQILKDWIMSDWQSVVYSDETRIICFNLNGGLWLLNER